MLIEQTVIKQLDVSRNKAGGTAAEPILIDIPEGTRTLQYAVCNEGAGAPIANNLVCRFSLQTQDVTVAQNGGTNIFSFVTINQSSMSTISANFGGNQLVWTVQANAGTVNEFALRLTFFSV
jgi:hypothetical protein